MHNLASCSLRYFKICKTNKLEFIQKIAIDLHQWHKITLTYLVGSLESCLVWIKADDEQNCLQIIDSVNINVLKENKHQ